MKVTHFQVCNLPHPEQPSYTIGNNYTTDIPRDYTTSHIRIPHYTSHALNSIHFPSLHKLHLDFPLSKKRHAVTGDARSDYIEDVHTSAFPTLATHLAYATNLTSLHLNINRLLQYEKGGFLESTYEVFGENLCWCTKLEELCIVNSGMVRGENTPMYSVGLANALVSTLKRRRDTLRVFYKVSGRPLLRDRFANDISSRTNCRVFSAFVQSANLEKLHITCSLGPYCDFVTACNAENDNGKKKPASIRDLTIECHQIYDVEEENLIIPPVGPMLNYFSECHSLQRLFLNMPKSCWGEPQTLDALTNLLTGKPELLRVSLYFSGYDDREGNLVKCLSDVLPQLVVNSTNMTDILLLNFFFVDEILCNKFTSCMEKLGFVLSRVGGGAAIRFYRPEKKQPL